METYYSNKHMTDQMSEGVHIATVDERGWYVSSNNGLFYLCATEIRHNADHKDCFFKTEALAKKAYKKWRNKNI